MQHSFDTPDPINLYVEIGRGNVHVRAAAVAVTTVRVDGRDADEVVVSHAAADVTPANRTTDGSDRPPSNITGSQVSVVAPRRRAGFFGGGEAALDVTVLLPTSSELVAKLGSADLVAEGTFGTVRTRTGSGDLSIEHIGGAAVIDTGSGDITLERIDGALRAKTGSGDVTVGATNSTAGISTGSGDVRIKQTRAPVVLKAGSGDLHIDRADAEAQLTSGSGDLSVGVLAHGSLQAKNATGDIAVGIPSGIPVWTDVSSVTGRISSNLAGGGRPAPGEDHLELRISTVSGDVQLTEA